ncbi:MAG: GspE/PulE family protein [Thermodesulfobacteriota bacterium]
MSNNKININKIGVGTKFKKSYGKLVKAIQSAKNPNSLMGAVRKQILDLFEVEMATIFIRDSTGKNLSSWLLLPGESHTRIHLPIDQASLAGYVATSGEIINIKDAYDEEELRAISPALRFDSSWDKQSGVVTRQILAAPLIYQKKLLGVFELMNSRSDKSFTRAEQNHLQDLAETLGIAIYQHSKGAKRKTLKYNEIIKKKLISAKDLKQALVAADNQNIDHDVFLIENRNIPRDVLGEALAHHYNTRYVNLEELSIDIKKLLKGTNLDYFRAAKLVPTDHNGRTLVVAARDPEEQISLIHEVRQVLRAGAVEVVFAFGDEIDAFWKRLTGKDFVAEGDAEDGDSEENMEEEARLVVDESAFDDVIKLIDKREKGELDTDAQPVVLLAAKIIENAYYSSASDIHIEPYGTKQDAEVRYRIDGTCSEVLHIPKAYVKQIIARFKILADLNIAERRKPQDGKIKFTTSKGKEIELRMATIPTANSNEDVVLRVLADSKPLPLDKILPQRIYQQFSELIIRPYGIVLVVGPTGSGKTTTLHSALAEINTPEKKIWTAEDPVEITQYRLRQVQVKPMIGLTFASAMRSFLRADPDVIMIGEMRDEETAGMAVEASLTGHIVFSTLHTNSAPETIVRLLDMGIDTFNFADSLLGVLAQRLVRTLCSKCKEPYKPDKAEYDHLLHNYGVLFFENINIPYNDDLQLYRAKGCEACNNTGYRGRMGIYELMTANDQLRKLIIERATVSELKEEAVSNGMTVLIQEGIHAIFRGKTDYKQVMRVCAQ